MRVVYLVLYVILFLVGVKCEVSNDTMVLCGMIMITAQFVVEGRSEK